MGRPVLIEPETYNAGGRTGERGGGIGTIIIRNTWDEPDTVQIQGRTSSKAEREVSPNDYTAV